MTDDELKALAEMYIAGEDVTTLASTLRVSEEAFKRLMKMAKAMYPEMNWPKKVVHYRSQTNDYVEMKDGKPGTRGVPQGSIVKKGRI